MHPSPLNPLKQFVSRPPARRFRPRTFAEMRDLVISFPAFLALKQRLEGQFVDADFAAGLFHLFQWDNTPYRVQPRGRIGRV
jgi:hypothetical protein